MCKLWFSYSSYVKTPSGYARRCFFWLWICRFSSSIKQRSRWEGVNNFLCSNERSIDFWTFIRNAACSCSLKSGTGSPTYTYSLCFSSQHLPRFLYMSRWLSHITRRLTSVFTKGYFKLCPHPLITEVTGPLPCPLWMNSAQRKRACAAKLLRTGAA